MAFNKCTNSFDLWEQDLWNDHLLKRRYDVLAQRTNQIQPHPEPTLEHACYCRVQDSQVQLDAHNDTISCSQQKSDLLTDPADSHHDQISRYNTHYAMTYPQHRQANIRHIDTESSLRTLGTPWTNDCPTQSETQYVRSSSAPAGRQLYYQYHTPNTNQTRSLFNNVSKEYYRSNESDIRNLYIIPDRIQHF
jgi:hypothetical protein